MGQPRGPLFEVDYLDLDKVTERKLMGYHVEFLISDSVKWRIPGPVESLSNLKDGEVVIFMNALKHGL